ncbi:MAG: HAD family hydrolase, partial [Bosea sp.]|uniref:HAD family hydrolase n=1 Tax=Bosea sp. (in: a-proteobacteria) TaxID=1871050 RepID=UPI0023941498|nr:HAD family hydrolase [Bosea sp. (in: a-proteobacteria)]
TKHGANRDTIRAALEPMRLMDGALETIEALRAAGSQLAVVSGSLDIVLRRFFGPWDDSGAREDQKKQCADDDWSGTPFSDVFINHLGFDEDGAIATCTPTPYDMDHKAAGLEELCRRYELRAEEVAFVGDNLNDLSIAAAAGFSIAFNCKSLDLARIADVTIRENDLRLTLPFLLD